MNEAETYSVVSFIETIFEHRLLIGSSPSRLSCHISRFFLQFLLESIANRSLGLLIGFIVCLLCENFETFVGTIRTLASSVGARLNGLGSSETALTYGQSCTKVSHISPLRTS